MFASIDSPAPEVPEGVEEHRTGTPANEVETHDLAQECNAAETHGRGGHRRETKSGADDEASLVAAARAGDTQAFGALVDRHRGACMRRAMLMMRNKCDAEDEVQNALWKAFGRLDQFRAEGSFGAWLSRIVENQCLMRIRERRNCRFVYLDEPADADVKIELVGQTADPEDQLGSDEVLSLVRREVSKIPRLLRTVMLMRDLNENPIPAIADELGLTIPAAKSRLMRARMELRSRVSKHCGRKGPGTLIQMRRNPVTAYTRAG
jgi:RNA polymerase sigma-70 factor (ECF subfamily)